MPTGVRGTKDYFKERYGLGERLSVRLAALLAHKVELTAAVIECLKESAACQRLILHPGLLEHAEELDTQRLASFAPPGEELGASFVVGEHDGWRTIALDEELLAEQGGPEAEAALPVLATKGELLHPTEITELFSRRDIAELELVLRTSADPNEKITAIRRLALTPAGEREKFALFAFALTDRSAEVRGEAADALTRLGLPAEVAEDARALAEGNEAHKRFAAGRIGERIRAADDFEMGVLLRIIAGTLRYEGSLEVRRLLIRAIEGACRAIAKDRGPTRDLVRILIGQLRDAVEALGPAVRSVLLVLGGLGAPDVLALLDEELASIAARPVRRLLVAVAGELAANDDERTRACRQCVDEILASSDPAVECLQIANALGKSGRHAVAAIARRLPEAPEAAQGALVRLLDVVGTRPKTSKATRAEIGRLLLEALRGRERATRLAVIQSTAIVSPAIPARTRAGIAAELLACLQEYANPGILDAIEANLANLGHPAVRPLLDTLGRAERARQRTSAARVLGLLLPRLEPRRTRTAHQAIDRALALLESGFPDRPALARALGQMCSGPAASAADVARVATTLRASVLDKELVHAALDGLAHLCLSPNATPSLRVDLTDFFARLFERDLPEIEAFARTDRDEIVYDLGAEVLAYTEMVPSIIQGFRNIAATASGALRAKALGCLLDAWRGIAEGELQLGPGNTEHILDALQAIGTLADADPGQRETITAAVALRRDFFPTYRVQAELLVAAGEGMAAQAAAFADEMLALEASERRLTETERVTLLAALVRLATAGALGHRAAQIRERIVTAALDADKRDIEAARPLLAQLQTSPAIPARLKARLARYASPNPQS